jgi:hypothetical protein
MAVGAGVVDQLRQPSLGLHDEAGDRRDGRQVVAEPDTAAVGEREEGVVDEVVGVLAGARVRSSRRFTVVV